ncbi:WXG100 family type VII secretion target [Kitasatospora sp. NPDC059817]|uniref:WXG100 family type VII secretion target n=1 Tax=Kitasatospora sp. NPDC059817 TaxID=3346961 RepID=UPI00364EB7AD
MAYTDFTTYSHAQLRTMAQTLNPGEVMAAGDPWRHAADTLKAIRATLTRASTEAAVTWEGATSDAFHTRMLHLADSINNAASYANDAANTLHNMSEAIAKAKRDMPEEPSTWEKVKDTVGDGVSSVFGGDDEHIPVADRRKAEAATVMQTLAMHYRIATPTLKPPPPPGTPSKPGARDDFSDKTGADQGGAAAVGGLMTGMGVGNMGSPGGLFTPSETEPSKPRGRRPSSAGAAPESPGASGKTSVASEPGIKGGVATAPVKPGPVNFGAGTTVDGTGTAPPTVAGRPASTGVTGAPVSPGPGTQTAAGPGGFGPGGGATTPGLFAGVRETPAVVEREPGGRGSLPAGPGAGRGGQVPEGVRGGGPGAGGRGGSVAGRVGGGVVGVGERPGAVLGGRAPAGEGASGGRRAFTEGGSGLGLRNRPRPESAGVPTSSQVPAVPCGGAQGRAKDKEGGRKRPDYLVEDEQTWASEGPVNPNVVK